MSQSKPDDVVRLDSSGRDVTDLPGLWSEDDKTVDKPTIKTIQQIMDDVQVSRVAITKAYGFLPANLWHKIERAKDALHLLALEAHAVKAQMTADAFERVDEQDSSR